MSYKYGYEKGSVRLSTQWEKEISTVCAELPHSCDEWVIGDSEDVENMITDLKAILVELNNSNDIQSR